MDFSALVARADDEALAELIGTDVVRLVGRMDPELATPSKLRALLLRTRSPFELLRDKQARGLLMELLPAGEADALASELGLTKSVDAYVGLRDLNIRDGSNRETTLFEFFGVEAPPRPPDPLPVADSVESEYGLFQHQRQVQRDLLNLASSPPYRVLMHMPTGAGKTRTAMHAICDHLRRHEPSVVVWLAHSEELCDQAAEEFERSWRSLGNRKVAIGRFWGDHNPDLDALDDGFLILGFAKTYRRIQDEMGFIGRISSRTSLVVMDEAHQAIAETYNLILETLVLGPKTSLVGLSATPGRTWNEIDEDEKLAQVFSRRKVGILSPSGENPVEYLIRIGALAKPRFESLHHSGNVSLTQGEIADLANGLDISPRILERLGQDELRNLSIIRRIERLISDHNRILVFAPTVESSDLIAAALNARGVVAASVTGKTGSFPRRKRIDEFRSAGPEPRVLCNYGVLTTGFDAPLTSAVVVGRPTHSLVLYFQMIGRGLRGPAAGGNKSAEIITVVDKGLPGFWDVGDAFLNWEDVW